MPRLVKEQKGCQRAQASAPFPTQPALPSHVPAVEKAQEPAQLPWSRGSWMRLGHFSEASKAVGSTSPGTSIVCKTKPLGLPPAPARLPLGGLLALGGHQESRAFCGLTLSLPLRKDSHDLHADSVQPEHPECRPRVRGRPPVLWPGTGQGPGQSHPAFLLAPASLLLCTFQSVTSSFPPGPWASGHSGPGREGAVGSCDRAGCQGKQREANSRGPGRGRVPHPALS